MSDDLVLGAMFAGRYRIERRIAAGGMGAVYEVLHVETSRRRALKVMHPDLVQNDDSRDRFRQEARVTARIESEYIVDVFDAGIDESTSMPYLVMELLQGEEVNKRIKRLGKLSPHDAVLYLHQAALALDKTHRARIVHRDLKPDNLFLCEREDGPPRIKLLDFGIAKIVAQNAASAHATQAVGTPLYMAPEQFSMDSAVSPATDLHALGMIAFTMLVGQAYWFEESKKGANVFAFATHATLGPQEAATARALRHGVTLPPAFDAWFARATARRPADRFPTAVAMIAVLSESLELPPPAAILASVYAQESGPSVARTAANVAPSRPAPPPSTPSLLGSATTTKVAPEPRRSMVVVAAGVLAISVMLVLSFVMFLPANTPSTTTTAPVAASSASTLGGLPEVLPVASSTPKASAEGMTTLLALPPASASAVQATSAAPAPAPRQKATAIPTKTTTTTTKKGTWIRD